MLNSLGYKTDKHSLAQSFFVYEHAGIFVTKVDLWFYAKDTAVSGSILMPVMIELRPMENGYPSSSLVVPGSTVSLPTSSITTTTTGPTAGNATSFTFDEPVFLNGRQDYCIVIYTNSSQYRLYIAEGNQFEYGSTEKRITKQPTLGSLFYSQNAITFTAAQEQDLTFKLYKADFQYSSAKVRLKNTDVPVRCLRTDPLVSTSGSASVQVSHPNHGMQVGDVVTMRMNGGSVSNLDSSHITGERTITAIDPTGYKFNAGTTASASLTGGGKKVTATKQIPYSILYPHLQTLMPNETAITTGFRGSTFKSYAGAETAYSMNHSTDQFFNVALNENNIGDRMYVIASPKKESDIWNGGGAVVNRSAEMEINMYTDNTNVTPVLDMQRASLTGISNQIDRQLDSSTTSPGYYNAVFSHVPETNHIRGSAASKHLTKAITLANDAVGLRVFIEAQRPSDAYFDLYFRTGTDGEMLTNKSWTLEPEETNNPSDDDNETFREYAYLIGGQGGELPNFTQFQLKIVMQSTNQAHVPLFRNLRVIAMGT